MKRLFKLFALAFLLIFVVLLILVFSLPYLVNLEAVRNTVAEKLSERLHAEVQIGEVSLRLIPAPALHAAKVRIENPRYDVDLKEGDLVLKLFPLFRRQIEVEKCLLKGLEFTLKEKEKEKKAHPAPSPEKTTPSISPREAFLRISEILAKIPEIRIKIEDGAFYQQKKGQKIPILQESQVFLALKKNFLEAEIRGKNPALKAFELSLKLWPHEELAEGLLKVKKFDLSKFPLISPRIRKSLQTDFSLDLSFRFEEEKWHLGFTGTAPCILAQKGKTSLLFDCSAVVGKAVLGPKLARVELKELVMKNPLLEATGVFEWQPQRSAFDFKIAKADWGEIRKRLLVFLDRNKGFKRFSEIVEDGLAEDTRFQSEAPSLKALFKLENLSYEGKAHQARVNIPKIGLSLDKAGGFVRVQKGLLQLKNARATCEKVSLHRAELFLNISLLKKEKDSPFFLETRFEGPFQGMKKILLSLPLPSNIEREISGTDGKGMLSGKVKVTGRLKKPQINFALHPQNLSLKYHRFPLPLRLTGGTINYASRKVTLRGVKVSTPKSHLSGMALLDLSSKPWQLDLSEARGVIALAELHQILEGFPRLKQYLERYRLEGERLTLIHASYRGPLNGKTLLERASLKVSGEGLRFSCPELPAPLLLERGRLSYHKFELSFEPSRIRWLGSSFNVAGEISFKPLTLFFTGSGEAGKQFVSWVFKKGRIPGEFFPRTPLKLSSFEFEKGGKHLRFAGKIETIPPSWANLVFEKDGPNWQLDGVLFPRGKESFRFRVSRAEKLALALHGEISAGEIKLFLARNPFLLQHLKTDLEGVFNLQEPAKSHFFGNLEISRVRIPYLRYPLWLESLSLKAEGRKIHVNHAEFDLDGTYFETRGDLVFSQKYLSFEGSAYSPHIVLENIRRLFSSTPGKSGKKGPSSRRSRRKLKVVVKLDLEAESVIYRNYEFSPFRGALFYHPGSFKIVVTESYLCDIALRGTFEKKEDLRRLELSFLEPEGRFEKALFCLFHKKDIEGPFELKGELVTYGKKKLFEESKGRFFLKSKEGHIYKFNLLSKLFAILSPLDIFSGNLPNFSRKGMDYDLLEIKGKFKKDYLKIEALQLNAPGLRFFGTGKLYFMDQKIDLTLLVSPFKAFNAVVSKVPLLGWILTGESKMLLAVPVKITGDLKDPAIIPLDPVSLGSQFLGIVGRTFKLPVKILTPATKEKAGKKAP